MVSADGLTAYDFDYKTGLLINPLATGAIGHSAPDLIFLGALRATVSLGYSALGLTAKLGPQTYTNFAVNSIGRDSLKVLSFGFFHRMPKFNPSYYWARSGGNYSLAVSKLGNSNSVYDTIYGGIGAFGMTVSYPQGEK